MEPNDILTRWQVMLDEQRDFLKEMKESGKYTEAEIEKQKNIIKHLEGLVHENHER